MSVYHNFHITTTTTTTNRHHPPLTSTATKTPQLTFTSFNPLLLSTTTATSRRNRLILTVAAAAKNSNTNPKQSDNKKQEEIEEDLPWIQEKALDIVEFSGSVTQALPGPRVGKSSLPWILALPLAYVGVSFVLAVVKTVRKFTSPKQARRNRVNKNAALCRSIDELLEKEGNGVQLEALKQLMQKGVF